ncbi:MAG: hypothetical protein M3R50_11700 [Bacteroidota bacterium]|nr:hypothetical protein [Bacteroidota bacterium]
MRNKRKIANNCEKATFMIEKKKFGALSFTENIELKIHLVGCEMCRIYQRQSGIIDKVAFTIYNKSADEELKLDEQYKKELQESIDEKLGRTKK